MAPGWPRLIESLQQVVVVNEPKSCMHVRRLPEKSPAKTCQNRHKLTSSKA
jgi:hypothetical protein